VIGERLSDRYAIEERIAVGGMGTVYRALDERLHRKVALKILKDHLAHDERFVERFRREARSVASLSHPNIASLYDYGEDDDRHYIVMELVDGSDLAHVLKAEGALDPERAEHIMRQVCEALSVAHAAGLVHRDVKPANVLLTADGTAKVTDFGIARATGDSSLTATGSILGTAHYLAPEQAAGDPATPQTDVYAAGVVLFEMLTGKVPFDAPSPVAVASQHMRGEVPTPSSIDHAIPTRLDDVVQKATAKDPKDRYTDAGEMAAVLGGVVAAPTSATTAELPGPAARTMPLPKPGGGGWNSRKAAVAVIGGLALIALLLLAFRLIEDGEKDGRKGSKPAAGAGASERSPELASVPDVRDLPVEEAQAELAKHGLLSVVVGPEDSGLVIGLDPEAGSEVLPGTTVTLLASPAEQPEDVEEDDPEEEDDEESGPPAHSEGKGKGKEKKDK
jgi:predicted Ser/Thr protein kinase